MSKNSNFPIPQFSYICGILTILTLLVWLLRGLKILAFLPGGVLLLLIFLSITTGVISLLQRPH
ncbi:hypothetical protein D5R40_13995 [Okeania hirsuta]|uniref:Uncharacterized protein n=1 Tax=Okeania hirsuta TaxID=1458930 RepID=A0A3N6NMY3_9CYAN|nr:hypothetical protein D4Z78_18330 [Okeania hirsuta]RQH42997.1 hypothetical protein D5R40_13995 [Okeania hirsuta]